MTDFIVGSDPVQTYAADLVCATLEISSGTRTRITTGIQVMDDMGLRLCSFMHCSRENQRNLRNLRNSKIHAETLH